MNNHVASLKFNKFLMIGLSLFSLIACLFVFFHNPLITYLLNLDQLLVIYTAILSITIVGFYRAYISILKRVVLNEMLRKKRVKIIFILFIYAWVNYSVLHLIKVYLSSSVIGRLDAILFNLVLPILIVCISIGRVEYNFKKNRTKQNRAKRQDN